MAQFVDRSAILVKIQHYGHAVDDLKLALRCGYPKNLRFKAYQRLALAHSAIGNNAESAETYKKLFQSLDEADLPIEKIKKMKNDCLQAVKMMNNNKPTVARKSEKPSLDLGQCSLHDKIVIKSTETRGRFSVARVPISAGEVVVSEVACLVSVSPGERDAHCYTCGRDTVAPLPSHVSSSTCFCGPECRTRGLAWHVNQSKITHFIRNQLDRPGIIEIPAFLAALEFTFKNDFYTQLETFKNWRNGPTKEIIPSHEKVLNMVKHFNTIKLKMHFSTSVLIHLLLKYLSYIPREVSLTEEKQLMLVICHHFAAIKSNIHTVVELRNGSEDQLQMKPVGVAMFPDVALHINHSCNPNTFVIDVGDRQLTVAARDIEEGEEITQIYLGHFGDTEKEKRQRLLLERYHFRCQCEACEGNFPSAQQCLEQCMTFAETPNELLKKPLSLDELTALDATNENLKNQVEKALVVGGSVSKAVEITVKRVKLICEHLREPHILYLMARMSLTKYMWCLYGNSSKWFKQPKLPVYF